MFTSVPAAGQSRAFAGMAADNGSGDVVSGFSEEASAQLAFGTGVAFGTAPKGVKNMASSGSVINGVVEHSFFHAPGTFGDLGATGLNPNASVRVKRRGRVWVALDPTQADGATPLSLTKGDRGFCRYSAGSGSNTQLGAWSNVTDSGHNLDATKQVEFVDGVIVVAPDGSNIALVDVDFANKP